MQRALLLCVVGLWAVPSVALAADLPTRAGTTADLAEVLAPLPTLPKAKETPQTEPQTASAPTEVQSCTTAADLVPADFLEKLNQLNSPALKGARTVPLGMPPLGAGTDGGAPAAGGVRRFVGGASSPAPQKRTTSSSEVKRGMSIENGVKVYRGPPSGN